MSEAWLDILRKKLNWLDGFAACLGNDDLNTFVSGFRRDLNRIEVGKEPGDCNKDKAQQEENG